MPKHVVVYDSDWGPRTRFLESMKEAEAKIMAAHDATPKWRWITRRKMRRLAEVAGGGSFRSVRREG